MKAQMKGMSMAFIGLLALMQPPTSYTESQPHGLTVAAASSGYYAGVGGFDGGSGTQEDPYLISTPQQLHFIYQQLSNAPQFAVGIYFQLIQDLDLSTYDTDSDVSNGNWTVSGMFAGNVDGNHHTVSNLTSYNQSMGGLFPLMGGGSISNLTIQNADIKSTQTAGILGAQYMTVFGTLSVQNVTTSGAVHVSGSSSTAGGLIGQTVSGSLPLSVTKSGTVGSTITAESQGASTGGLIGQIYNIDISESYADASISGGGYAGGLVGYKQSNSPATITNSYSKGTVSGAEAVGGFLGHSYGYLTMTNILSTTTLELSNQPTYQGGLIGFQIPDYGTVTTNAYWDKTLAGLTQAGVNFTESDTTKGLTTTQLASAEVKTLLTGFDFESVWRFGENGKGLSLTWQPLDNRPALNQLDLALNVHASVVSFSVPTSLSFVLNPNLADAEQFVAPTFTLNNDSMAPLTLSLSAFNQKTAVLEDVLGSRYSDAQWKALGARDTHQFALALTGMEGESWLTWTQTEPLYAKAVQSSPTPISLGVIKPQSAVSFTFNAKHGAGFTEALAPEYDLTFIFNLFDDTSTLEGGDIK